MSRYSKTAALAYWREQLANITVPDLPTTRTHTQRNHDARSKRTFVLSADLLSSLNSHSAHQNEDRPSMGLLAAYYILLWRYTDQNDLVVNAVLHDTPTPTLLRLEVHGNLRFREMLTRMNHTLVTARSHRDVDIREVVDQTNIGGHLCRIPAFMSDMMPREPPSTREVKSSLAHSVLELRVSKSDSTIVGVFDYATEEFDPRIVESLARHYVRIVQELASPSPSPRRLANLDMLGTSERRQLLLEWNDTPQSYSDRCIHELFEETAERQPHDVALVCGDEQITFSELNRQANRLARYLQQRGVGPEYLVGVCIERSKNAVVALLGILKAGGVYVYLDPDYPTLRLSAIIGDAGLSLIVTTSDLLEKVGRTLALCLDTLKDVLLRESPLNVTSGVTPENAAYIIYTSGTTGRPKGAVEIHRSMTTRLTSAFLPDIQEGDVCALNSSLSFGISASRLFLPLASGLKVVVISDEVLRDIRCFVNVLERHGVTSIFAVPSLLRILVGLDASTLRRLTHLRVVAVGGGTLTPELVRAVTSAIPGVTVVNLYGSTEIGTTATMCVIDENSADRSIGRPVANTRVYILDQNMELVPVGAKGQIYVAASHLAREYLNDPEYTADRFVRNPFVLGCDARMYRTGDLGRWLPSGDIEFLGRVDDQVKIRGFRIEMGEVENVLQTHEAVDEAALSVGMRGENRHLVAYVKRAEGKAVQSRDLRRHLAERLPTHMIPKSLLFVDALPKTAVGKVDRQKLARIDQLPNVAERNPDDPGTPLQNTVSAILADVLKLDLVGLETRFSELGGDSLDAMQAVIRIQEECRVAVPVDVLYSGPVVESVSRFIEQTSGRAEPHPIRKASHDDSAPVSFLQLGRLSAEFKAEFLGAPLPQAVTGFALSMSGPLDIDHLRSSVDELVCRHEALRTRFVPIATVGDLVVEGWDEIYELSRGVGPITARVTFDQRISDIADVPFELVDLALDRSGAHQVEAFLPELLQTRFDYSLAPLVRTVLLRHGRNEHILVVVLSHLIADGWSMNTLHRELLQIYTAFSRGLASPLKEPRIQYVEFANWERERLLSGACSYLRSFWRKEFGRHGFLNVSDLTFARPEPVVANLGSADEAGRLDPMLCRQLRLLARAHNVSLYVVLLTAFYALLRLHLRRDDVGLVGFFANRHHPDLTDLVGWCATHHMLAASVPLEACISELFENVQSKVTGAIAHQEIPLSLLSVILDDAQQDHVGGENCNSSFPRITFEFRSRPKVESPPNLFVTRLHLPPREETEWGLRMWLTEQEEAIATRAVYRVDLFKENDVKRMLDNFVRVLHAVLIDPEIRVHDLRQHIIVHGAK